MGNRTRVKVKKNKVAPPFRESEFDIMYNGGISKEGDILDLGVEYGIVDKRGAYFRYGETLLGQGRENAKGFLRERPAPLLEAVELELSLEEFLRAAAAIPEPLPEPEVRPPSQTVTVEEKSSLLKRLLSKTPRVPFERLFRPWGTRAHAVAGFLAALELAKQQVLRIEQVKPFASLWLLRGKPRAPGADTDSPARKGETE